jgi:hypothetical protein
MDAVTRAAAYLRDNVGQLTRPGNPSFDPATQRWFVPISVRALQGDVVVGDLELDSAGHIVYAPSKEEIVKRAEELCSRSAATSEHAVARVV